MSVNRRLNEGKGVGDGPWLTVDVLAVRTVNQNDDKVIHLTLAFRHIRALVEPEDTVPLGLHIVPHREWDAKRKKTGGGARSRGNVVTLKLTGYVTLDECGLARSGCAAHQNVVCERWERWERWERHRDTLRV